MLRRYVNRLLKLFLIFMIYFLDGYTKARFLKKIRFFRAQGESCYCASYNFGTEPYLVELGNNVYFAADVRLINHDMSCKVVRDMTNGLDLDKFGTIKIGSYVFLGLGTIVMAGVTICDRVIVAAGSVISKDFLEEGIYGGIPAKKIMEIDVYNEKVKELNLSYAWRIKGKAPTKSDLIEHFFSEKSN